MKANRFYSSITSAELLTDCTSISINKWESLMENTVKADANKVERIIRKFLPELADELCLQFYNPYRNQCRRKDGLIIYVHSCIEYFIKVQ